MGLGKRLINTGAATCLTETTDIFGDSKGKLLYSFDTDASDASGVYNGTPTDVTFGVSGKINTSVRFPQTTTQRIQFTNPISNASNADFNVSFFASFRSITGGSNGSFAHAIISNPSGQYGAFQILTYYHASGLVFMLQRVVGSTIYYSTNYNTDIPISVTLNTFNHYSVNYTASSYQIEIFKDGVSQGTSTLDASLGITPISTSSLGYSPSAAANAFPGSMDQFRIFSRKLTSSEISSLATETACVHTATANTADFPSTATAIGHYPLDNSSEDNKGTNDGTDTGIEYRFGKYGQAALFDGTQSNEIDLGYNTNYSNFSISAWINPSATTTQHPIVGKWWDGSNRSFQFWHTSSGVGVDIAYTDANTDHIFYNTNVGALSLNRWYFVCVTWQDGVGFTITVDDNTQTHSVAKNIRSNTSNWFIGQQDSRGIRAFTGLIDQVRIFTSVLTASQITELFNEKPETDTSNFKTVLYEGTGATQYISNVGMDLETSGGLVWTKRRTGGDVSHALVDSLRTISTSGTSYIASDETNKAATSSNMPSSFEANGFFVQGNGGRTNSSGQDFVSWIWLGGGEAVSNGNGSRPSSVTANTNAGFSIAKWTGDNSSATIGHGLSSPPEVVIRKPLDTNASWAFDTTATGSFGFLFLDTTANFTAHGSLNAPTSTVFSTGGTTYNKSGEQHLAYCFHSVAEYSRISTYPGSGNSQTIYVTDDDSSTGSGGFQPSWIMIKNLNSSSGNWMIYDAVRDTDGTLSLFLEANTDDQEATASTATITPISNGFTIGNSNSVHINDSSDTYLYMAFK